MFGLLRGSRPRREGDVIHVRHGMIVNAGGVRLSAVVIKSSMKGKIL
ncbi:MAG: hypothetical protein ACTTKL_09980 [Treponema sp.]